MRQLRLLSTTAAIVLLGVSAVSAQGIKANETTGTSPTAQQNAPPALKSDKQSTTNNGTSTGAVAKDSSDANSSSDVKPARTAHSGYRRHFAWRYESSRNGPLYDSYEGRRGYRGCRDHNHSPLPWLWC